MKLQVKCQKDKLYEFQDLLYGEDEKVMKNNKILFDEDQKKIEDAVTLHAMGSYQVGEVARLSATLYDMGIDVVAYLERLQKNFGIIQE